MIHGHQLCFLFQFNINIAEDDDGENEDLNNIFNLLANIYQQISKYLTCLKSIFLLSESLIRKLEHVYFLRLD